jgi:hypothetical protein
MAAGATYEPIATQTLASAAASIDFNSIAATYTDLRLVLVGSTSASTYLYFTINNTTTPYSYTYLYGTGAVAGSKRNTSGGLTGVFINDEVATGVSSRFLAELDFFSYAGSTNKTSLSRYSGDRNGAGQVQLNVNLWGSTSALTQITLYPSSGNFEIGTTATLYGIKAA